MSEGLGHLLEGVEAARLCRAEVVDAVGSTIDVTTLDGGEPLHLRCELLATTDAAPLTLHPGDVVLVWSPSGAEGQPVVIGRVGIRPVAAAPAPAPPSAAPPPEPPETLTLEATQSLTLRVGDGSITIRADGKILIKGTDLVSHAQRTNRIRGGSVAIN